MFFFILIALVNLAVGFALAMYLGGHYHTMKKFGIPIPLPFKAVSLVANSAEISQAKAEPIPPAEASSAQK
jgi:hypothetical protein